MPDDSSFIRDYLAAAAHHLDAVSAAPPFDARLNQLVWACRDLRWAVDFICDRQDAIEAALSRQEEHDQPGDGA